MSEEEFSRKYQAVVLGATGATGKALVRELLIADKWNKVTTIGRRAVADDVFSDIPNASSKLEQIVTDTDAHQFDLSGLVGWLALCTLGFCLYSHTRTLCKKRAESDCFLRASSCKYL
eukprot:TRINITY_DN4988_c0_g1_i1.p1 TRINITY_DN4988_c0_g1~~TRINITY_DN4988_c0_g1_i1.p1  ORF type:complete len:118 (+),score=8.77 TRINITY_DN4988_c0_g1_i1:64-417(+)